jgi:hypothetical protein
MPAIDFVQIDEGSARLRADAGKLRNALDGRSKTALIVEQAGKPVGRGVSPEAALHPPSEGAWATCDYGTFFGNGVNSHNYYDPFGFHQGAVIAMCDGSVMLMPESMPREIIVALLSRDGSEIITASDWQ